MSSTEQKNDTGSSLSMKWIYVIIVALVLGFGTYGYFKVKKWVRYASIERYEKPITDYTITKVYSDESKQKKKRKGVDDENEKKPNYYMEVAYQGKDYKLEIEEYTYDNFNKNPEAVTLYYDAKGDEVFVAGTGGANLLVAALGAAVLLLILFILLVRQLIKAMRRKKR